jgi:DNA-binding transcriptional MerR regulator
MIAHDCRREEEMSGRENIIDVQAVPGPAPGEEGQAWVSKKELLAQTGISYGQLYRWKREKLIPEEWFNKRSAPTGQETYFPRRAMLERIRTIQDLKGDKSLEQIARVVAESDRSRSPFEEEAKRIAAVLVEDEGFIKRVAEQVADMEKERLS